MTDLEEGVSGDDANLSRQAGKATGRKALRAPGQSISAQ